jgi:hypothetical protein
MGFFFQYNCVYLGAVNTYQLDNVSMDQDFLKGIPVFCKAVVTQSDLDNNLVKEGDKIVVQLSNRSKYMGRIKSFRYNFINGHAVGQLEIIKA